MASEGRFSASFKPKSSGTVILYAVVDWVYSSGQTLTVGSGSASFFPFDPAWLVILVVALVLVAASLYRRRRNSWEYLIPERNVNDWSDL